MKLYYSPHLNPRLCVAAARFLDAPVDYRLGYALTGEEKAVFRGLNPMKRYPVLVEEGRPVLWETDAIVCRLSARAGSDFWRRGDDQPEMIRWISWAAYHLLRAGDPVYFSRIVMPTFTTDRLPDAEIEDHVANWRKLIALLDAHLADSTWLLGAAISYADFRVGAIMPFVKEAGLPLDGVPNVIRWKEQLDQIAAWKDPFEGLEAAP